MPFDTTDELRSLIASGEATTGTSPSPETPRLVDHEVRYRVRPKDAPRALPENLLAALVRDARSRLKLSPDDSGVREVAATFGGANGVECRVIIREAIPEAVAPPAESPRPPRRLPFGVACDMTRELFPSFDEDHRLAQEESHAACRRAVAAGAIYEFHLFDPAGPAARKYPSIALLGALHAVPGTPEFPALLDAVLRARAVAVIAVGRAQGLPDEVVLEAYGLSPAEYGSTLPGRDEMSYLRSAAAKAALETLRLYRVPESTLDGLDLYAVVDRLLAAHLPDEK